jgi:hypothetical protein
MIYAQINQNVIANVIDIEDVTLLPLFAKGFDLCLRIDGLDIIPSIGWTYNPVTCAFSQPLTLPQSIVTDSMAFGNQIILDWNAMNLMGDIYDAGQTVPFLTYVGQLYQLLSLGYLSDADDMMTTMINDSGITKTNLSPFLTNDILTTFQIQIQVFLLTLPSLE